MTPIIIWNLQVTHVRTYHYMEFASNTCAQIHYKHKHLCPQEITMYASHFHVYYWNQHERSLLDLNTN